ncbi:MAG: MopE-related protein [Pseudomonadota bacterium]|nr:MopE-related protein [Pseudomonadota bacterium]
MLLFLVSACTAPEEAPAAGLENAFAEAAEAYDVPVEVLIAVSYEVSRFDDRGGEPNRERGVGVMNLREGSAFPSLAVAAVLSRETEDALRGSATASIAGAAALMRAEADAHAGEHAEASLEAFYPVVAAYSGAPDPEVAEDFAARVYDWIQWGLTAEAPGGELLVVDPTDMPWRDDRVAVMGSGLVDQYAPACSSNYSSASRSAGDARYVVIHTTQGSYSGTVSWFQNCSAEVTAHYTVRSSDGHITQSVDESDVAWHAGNSTYNWASVGIEHEGYVDAPETWYTEEMYRSSAALTADICDRHGIPKDRDHIIGHSEVPSATHTDPGSGWDWDYYICLVNGSSGGSGGMQTCYADDDGDGYGDASQQITSCGGCPSGYTSDGDDCNDGNARIHPGAVELCDALDNDCQGGVDEGYDRDADGYRTCDGDCDDDAPALHPDAAEPVDGVDNDCDWVVDEESSVYDDDGDGWTETAGDCDDGDAFAFPGAPEMPDGGDDDCDGATDEGTTVVDDDGDGWSESAGDCDDGDPEVYPGRAEIADGLDNDCDGRAGEGTAAFDDDGDSFAEQGGDCNDANRLAWPGAPELADGVDNDCNGVVDDGTLLFDDDGDGWTEAAGDCNDDEPGVYPDAEELGDGLDQDCDWLTDNRTARFDDDHDGWTEEDGDCDDAAPGTFPGAPERVDDADNDCNGMVDDRTVAFDDDGDGFAEDDGDCDDLRAAVFPGGTEALDGFDNDCDGLVDDETVVFDDDGDGWTEQGGDCDDGNAHTRPGASERIDGEDSDCDGVAERPEGWLAGSCATAPASGSWALLAALAAALARRRSRS